MVIKCEAIFNGDRVYISGQTVSGRICLTLSDRILVKAVALKITGYAFTEWDTAKPGSKKPNMVSGREDYISTTTYFIGSEDATTVMIPPSNYTFTFACTIPEKSPSSYESKDGHIRYQLSVILEYPERTDSVLCEVLHVIKALDLRPQSLVLQLPIDLEVYESKCCGEFWKTPMYLYVNVPQAGFVPGDNISIYARLLNDSQIPLKHMMISLNQVVKYTSKVPREITRTERYNVIQVLNSLAGKQPLREFLERIQIPNLPPTCDSDCTVLQLSYEVEAVVVAANENRGVVVRLPILLGSTGITSEFERDVEKIVMEPVEKTTEKNTPPGNATAVIQMYSGAAEPATSTSVVSMNARAASSFQEAEFMSTADFSKEEKHSLNKDKSGFKPKYLYYEINEDIEMTQNSMEITKEINIVSS